jgi:hypothetical protein
MAEPELLALGERRCRTSNLNATVTLLSVLLGLYQALAGAPMTLRVIRYYTKYIQALLLVLLRLVVAASDNRGPAGVTGL